LMLRDPMLKYTAGRTNKILKLKSSGGENEKGIPC